MMKSKTGNLKASFVLLMTVAVLILTAALPARAAVEAEGYIVFDKEDGIYCVQPDGRGEKKLTEGGHGPVVVSPDGKQFAYLDNGSIMIKPLDGDAKTVYQGTGEEELSLISWYPENRGISFRKMLSDGQCQLFIINVEEGLPKDLGTFHELPSISQTGEYWVYSTWAPDGEFSEVFGAETGEEGSYIFRGRLDNVLAWDPEGSGILYGINDTIYGYSIPMRARYKNTLPFKEIFPVAFSTAGVLYYYKEYEDKETGLKLLDYGSGDQIQVVDRKTIYRRVTENPSGTKMVVFAPMNPNDFMGEGELHLIDTLAGESKKLTREVGYRVFNNLNMQNHWSSDGKYFIFEEVKMKFSNIKKSEMKIAGEGDPVKVFEKDGLFRHALNPVWANLVFE